MNSLISEDLRKFSRENEQATDLVALKRKRGDMQIYLNN
jgi:hypothetical protein